jgi:hypothetical protein
MQDVNEKRLRWDVIKAEIRGFTTSFRSYKKLWKGIETKLLNEIDKLEKYISTKPDDNKWQQLVTAKGELPLIEHKKSMGIQISNWLLPKVNCLS